MNENGHIYSPVSVDDVKSTLKENSDDVGSLCMSSKINPYSLIRPTPSATPWIGVEEMKTLQIGDLQSGNDSYSWERKQWGYQVPYVGAPQDIPKIRDVAWYKPTPSNTDYKILNHFDGYLHRAVPSLYWSLGDVKMDDEIIMMIGFGDVQNDIVSKNGVNNNGGVVSVLEVFGNEAFYYGAIIAWPGTTRWFISPEKIEPGQRGSGVLYTELKAVASRTYEITPFITDKAPVGNNIAVGAKFYGLKFAPNFESYKTITIPEITISVTLRAETDSQRRITALYIGLHNQFNYIYRVSNFGIEITYMGNSKLGYPFTRTSYLGETITVSAKSDTEYKWNDIYIPWDSDGNTSIRIMGFGTLTSPNGGTAKQFQTNMIVISRSSGGGGDVVDQPYPYA